MAISGIDHVNIRTMDIAASAAFYVNALGFDYRPATVGDGIATHWLYDASGMPIIHLRLREADGPGTGSFDHIALRCDDKEAALRRLDAQAIPYRAVEVIPGVTQVVLTDPHGITLELNFRDPA